jgi:hypothetical protein
MVTPSVGSVVLVRFPFSDLSATKLRPAVVLAGVDRDDWILSQVTSNPYSDTSAVELGDSDFYQVRCNEQAMPDRASYFPQTARSWNALLAS